MKIREKINSVTTLSVGIGENRKEKEVLDNPNVKPCPICGRQPIFYETKNHGWRIECRWKEMGGIRVFGYDLAESIERWNEQCSKVVV